MASARRAASPARTRGMTEPDRASWERTYRENSYRDLPWFSPDPSTSVARAVEERWLRPPGPVLDIGCGAGTNVLWLARHGFRASGVDVAPGAIAAAERRREREGLTAKFRVADALALDYPRGSFRGALDNGCFHTLPIRHRPEYVQSVARVLKPEGRFVLSWIGREETRTFGPPHRPSVSEVAELFEPSFLLGEVEYRPSRRVSGRGSRRTTLSGYTARLIRRSHAQPPPR